MGGVYTRVRFGDAAGSLVDTEASLEMQATQN